MSPPDTIVFNVSTQVILPGDLLRVCGVPRMVGSGWEAQLTWPVCHCDGEHASQRPQPLLFIALDCMGTGEHGMATSKGVEFSQEAGR